MTKMCRENTLILVLILFVCSSSADYRDVVLDQGVVRGYNIDEDDVISFYGIPYATVPTGEDRFQAPLPPRSWDGILHATGDKRNLVCYQGKGFDPARLKAIKVYDCLITNVYMPKETNKTDLPVLYHIHGGAFQFGNGHEMNPAGLARKNMIIVNFNYRLGIQGFLCLNNKYVPGNAGMKDMIAALKWVKANIARFGGDPDNISISGASAGSVAAEYVLLSPMSEGILKRAMFEGGGALGPSMFTMEPITVAEKFANQQGVFTNKNVTLLEEFYRNLTDEQLNLAFIPDHKHTGFTTCVETHNLEGVENFFSEAPVDIINSGNYVKIPILTGYTPYDGMDIFPLYPEFKGLMEANFTEFIPNNVHIESEKHALEITGSIKKMYFPTGEITPLGFIDFITDSVFVYAQYASARLYTRNGAPVHLYYFTFNGTVNLANQKKAPIWGPGHVAQSLLIYKYNDPSIYTELNDRDLDMQDKLRDIYYSFCKDGNPVPNFLNVDWSTVTVDKVNSLVINDEFYMDEFPLRERLLFWDRIYKFDYKNPPRHAVFKAISVFTGVFGFTVFLPMLWFQY